MKKIFTLFAALAMVMSMSAAKLYLTPNSNWTADNARFAAYFFGNGEKWISMTKVAGETNLYEVEAPAGYPKVIFCRMNPSSSANNWNDGVKWNQTGDLTIPTDGKNHYTVKAGTWDKGGGEWTIWPVPAAKNYVDVTITVTANAAASIKWHSAGDKLANATDYVAMNAGENNTYTYTLAQVDDFSGVKYTIKVGDVVSEEQTTSTNVTADFKTLMKQAFLKGSMNDWGDNGKMTIADDYLTASIVLSLNAGSYEWKMYVGVDWLGGGKTVTRENNTHKLTDGDNCKLTADIKGNYTFTWTYATNTLTVTYPAVKYNVNVTAENGTVTGAGEYEKGAEAELTATPAKGYEFTCWTSGEDTVSTANPYKFTVTADVALVANFKLIPPTKYTVTVTATAEGENVVSGGGEYEDGEEVTVTASEDLEGWVFIGWTEDGEFVANDPEYNFVVKGDVELVAVYAADLGEKEVTDLVIDGENLLLTGSVADFEMGTMNLELALGEYDEEEGTFLLTEESKLYVGETNFTFVDGMAAVDMNTNSAMAIVVFEHNGAYYHMTVNMSKKIEATVIEIDNATVTIEERSLGFGDEVYHVLKMESTWSDGETTYPVLLETTEFDQTKESQEVAATITVGGMGDEDPWLGSAEGDVTITVADGVVTVEGLLENAYAWPAPIAFDLTISGTLPVEKIAYELNGGAFPEVKVPTNAELWEAFKPYYNEYYLANGKLTTPRADQPIDKVSTFASAYMQQIMTDEASEYKWLGDYVLSVATAAGVTLSTDMASANESGWRWAVHAFFNAAAGQYGAAGIDFTEAGKPEAWGAAYLAEYGVVLPTEPVDAPYTLPTPVKEGYKFVGWYDNAEGTGEAYTVIPAGWSGTLYAIWEAEGPATALDNIAIEGKVVKTIINGQLIIIKNGVQYNAQGAVIK